MEHRFLLLRSQFILYVEGVEPFCADFFMLLQLLRNYQKLMIGGQKRENNESTKTNSEHF